MAMLKHVFPVMLLLLILLAPVSSAALVPLVFHDSGYEVVPGYRIPVMLHAEGERNPVEYGFAAAAVKAGPIEVGYDSDPPGWGGLGGMPIYFYVKINGQEVLRQQIDSIPPLGGKKAYETTVYFELDCNGNLKVSTDYGSYSVQVEQCKTYDIFEQAGSVDGTIMYLVSKVTYGESEQTAECGCNNNGDLPEPGSGFSGDPKEQTWNDLVDWLKDLGTKIAWAMLGLIAVVLILQVVLGKR